MMKYFHPHPLWHLWQQKYKTPSTRARIHARKNTFGQYPTIPSLNQTNQSTSPPFRIPSPQKNIHQRRNIHQQWNNQQQIIAQNQYSFALLKYLFRKTKITKHSIQKEKTAQICRFFTLWGYFYPYTNRGGASNQEIITRTKNTKTMRKKERNEAIISRQTFLRTQEE